MRHIPISPRPALIVLSLVALALLAPPAPAAAQTVKLATLVPDGSVWDKALEDMGARWQKETEGRVELRVYPGGVAGDETDMLRKMRIGQLHAAALTTSGLIEIDPAFRVFEIPLFFRSYPELFHVVDALEPLLTERLEAKGFKLLTWGHAGWAYFFTRQPVETVEELKKQKIFVWAGNDRLVRWWKDNGYQPVALAATDILTGLQTGMIDALPTTPLIALSLQWYRDVPHMVDIGLAPIVGAVVITRRAWDGISSPDREHLLAAAADLGERFAEEIPEQDARALAEMEKRGLTLHRVQGTAKAAGWEAAAKRFADSMRGSMVSEEVFDLARAARQAHRASAEAEGKGGEAGGSR